METPGGLAIVGDRGVSATVFLLYTNVIPTVLRKMIRQYHTRQIHPAIAPAVEVVVAVEEEPGKCVGSVYVSLESSCEVAVGDAADADADAVADDTDAVALAIAVAVDTTIDLTSINVCVCM